METGERVAQLERALLMHVPMNPGDEAASKVARSALGLDGILSFNKLRCYAEGRGYDPRQLWPQIVARAESPEGRSFAAMNPFPGLANDDEGAGQAALPSGAQSISREESLLRGLPKTARVIEIGPAFAPIVPKRDGWNAFIIDHASREGLIEKYGSDPNLDVSKIEEVDFVWTGGSIAEAVPEDQHGTFDAFIASHVIEHTTDVVTFLRAAQTLLRPDGTVILAIPDKRKCFDFFRSLSNTGQAIEAYDEQRSRHTMATHLNHWLNVATKPDGAAGFFADDARPMRFAHPLAGLEDWMSFSKTGHYVDAHAWAWTPASFELMMLELAHLGFINLRVDAVAETEHTEFRAWLRKGYQPQDHDTVQARRLALNYAVIQDLAAQTQQIPEEFRRR